MTIKKSKQLISASAILLTLLAVGVTQASVKSSTSEHLDGVSLTAIGSSSIGSQAGAAPSIAGPQTGSKLSPQYIPCVWFPILNRYVCQYCPGGKCG